jgi:hypothetical protein
MWTLKGIPPHVRRDLVGLGQVGDSDNCSPISTPVFHMIVQHRALLELRFPACLAGHCGHVTKCTSPLFPYWIQLETTGTTPGIWASRHCVCAPPTPPHPINHNHAERVPICVMAKHQDGPTWVPEWPRGAEQTHLQGPLIWGLQERVHCKSPVIAHFITAAYLLL